MFSHRQVFFTVETFEFPYLNLSNSCMISFPLNSQLYNRILNFSSETKHIKNKSTNNQKKNIL